MKSLVVKNAFSDAVDFDFSKLSISNIQVLNSGNDCVDVSFGKYEIMTSSLNKCGDKAISIGEKSDVKLNKVFLSNFNKGVVVKETSFANIESLISEKKNKIDISSSLKRTCVEAYKKKQEFIGGLVRLKKHNCGKEQFFKDSWSNIIQG